MSDAMLKVTALAQAMREVGAGRATLDGLTLDLTVAPFEPPKIIKKAEEPSAEEEAARREATLLAASGGKRPRLPWGRS